MRPSPATAQKGRGFLVRGSGDRLTRATKDYALVIVRHHIAPLSARRWSSMRERRVIGHPSHYEKTSSETRFVHASTCGKKSDLPPRQDMLAQSVALFH